MSGPHQPRRFLTSERRTCLLCGRPIRLAELGQALAILEGHEGWEPHVCVDPIRLDRVAARLGGPRATDVSRMVDPAAQVRWDR